MCSRTDFDIQTGGIEDRAVTFDNADDLAVIFLLKEFRCVIAHITKALNHNRLAAQSAGETGPRDIFRITEKLLKRILHTAPRRLDAACDTMGRKRLAGDTGTGVNIRGVHAVILVSDPGHFPLACAHIRGRDVL